MSGGRSTANTKAPAVSAVAIEKARRRAVERDVAPVDNRYRDALAVPGGGPEPDKAEALRAEPSRARLALDKRPRVLGHVIIVGFVRPDRGRDGEADRVSVEVASGFQPETVHRVRHCDF